VRYWKKLMTAKETTSSPPPWWVEMGALGTIDPAMGLLRTYDTGKQQVGQLGFHLWDFWFDLDAGLEQRVQGSIVTGSGYGATLNIYIDENTVVGPLTGPLETSGLVHHSKFRRG
jgi:hypothetical protein